MLTPLLATGAFVGGLFWVIKGGAILLGYRQPDYVFEVAPFLFALVTLGLARWVPRSRARNVAGRSQQPQLFCASWQLLRISSRATFSG